MMNRSRSREGLSVLVWPFPQPGPALQLAYRELDIAANGTAEQQRGLGVIADLPRPWAPATCKDPSLRTELWSWLDAVVVWINHELVFDPAEVIPACWPQHAHLVHELAILADLRWRAERTFDSGAFDEWHRFTMPAFLKRMRDRVADHCAEEHPSVWPSAGRFNRHVSEQRVSRRGSAFAADLRASRMTAEHASNSRVVPELRLVDGSTGELYE